MSTLSRPASASEPHQREGTVRRLALADEGRSRVLRFVLETDSGELLAVEMRGDELRGVLGEGDRVRLPGAAAGADGTSRPRSLANLTTGARVEMRRTHRALRSARALGAQVVAAAVGAIVSASIALGFSLFSAAEDPGSSRPGVNPLPPPPPRDDLSWWEVGVVVALAAVLLAVGLHAVRGRSRRLRWSFAVGFAVPLAVAAVLALADV
jgi:hypothetical protein